MSIFDELKEQLQANHKTIVFPEGDDPRILYAANRLLKEKALNVILLGDTMKVFLATRDDQYDCINEAEFIDPKT